MYCNCPKIPTETLREREKILLNDKSWNLLCLQDMYNAGNSLSEMAKTIPFRSVECTRTLKCCGVCTRQCHTRCVQDCLNRLYMWRRMVETTPEEDRERIPLNIRMIVTQEFETLYDLSWVVGEIISANTNTVMKQYLQENNMHPQENPYKLDYSPTFELDPRTGRKAMDPETRKYKLLEWPKSGLCPWCLPRRKTERRQLFREHKPDESYP